MVTITQQERDYVIWQNRAVRFYAAARLCYLNGLYAPAAYCAAITLELLMKATLIYHHKSFSPKEAGHALAALGRTIRNRVPSLRSFALPHYFVHEKRYLEVARYPRDGAGVYLPASFLHDLDDAFLKLLRATPFQHNTELKRILRDERSSEGKAITRSNREARSIRSFLQVAWRRA